ncbi:hypothetical protein HHI36_010526 [Cryptolaemus montrouzieri]|uniref:Uncharacterized protein n=1 Tax=Cryptolaemus montrouzieri TaxID=559131 RepID=A0ABD2MJ05_9CUCU
MIFFEIFWLFLSCLTLSVGYNILAIFPHDGISHLEVFAPIVRNLVSRGHNLTVISHHSLNIKSKSHKELLLSNDTHAGRHLFELGMFDWPAWMLIWISPLYVSSFGISSCHHLLSHPEVQELMTSDGNFDLILSELFNSECNLGFVDKFKAPLVGLSSTTLMAWHTDRFGQPDNPSYIPNNHLWYTSKMSFLDRVGNALGDLLFKTTYYFATKQSQLISEKHLKTKMSSFFDMMKSTSLVLVNSHWSLHSPRPFVPAVVEIGGSHIPSPTTLPKEDLSEIQAS